MISPPSLIADASITNERVINKKTISPIRREQAGIARKIWNFKPDSPPKPAWDTGAPWNAFAAKKLFPIRCFDYAFHTTIADEGVFFGSSADDSVHKLDLKTGRNLWTFTTNAPVRVAPSYGKGYVYFGSDDGFVYCLQSDSGKLKWKYSPSPKSDLICSDGALISPWPIRSGVSLLNGKAYFAAALLPWREAYVCALDALTGRQLYSVKNKRGLTPAGKMTTDGRFLLFPAGNSNTLVFNIENGEYLTSLPVMTSRATELYPGVFALAGTFRKNTTGMERLRIINLSKRKKFTQYENGRFAISQENLCFVATTNTISAYDKTRKLKWRKKCDYPYSIAVNDNLLFLGHDGSVSLFKTIDGKLLQTIKTTGRIYALTATNSLLTASSDTGEITAYALERKSF
jgi:outer membrane protein assembly factor BamB